MMKAIVVFLLLSHGIAFAQTVPFSSDRWKFRNQEYSLVTFQGKDAVLLKKNGATLEDANFLNGIIEYDVAFPQSRAFIGIQFRIQDETNFEEFYVRPHQSGNPDANQYTPVFKSNAGWQLYYGEGYGAPVKYTFNEWIHVKLVILGQYMDVYINDMETPVLFAELKQKPVKGPIGLRNDINENYFANVSVTPTDNVTLKGKPKPSQPLPAGTIEKWSISNGFAEKGLAGITNLKDLRTKIEYKSFGVEQTGTLNISSTTEINENSNTVLARIVIDSDKEQIKKITFGFSDRVKVFVNGTAVFSGEDNFNSRDYRFLGTVGYFDAVYVQLKKGKNEIHFAVSEDFGGWGIKAKVEDLGGVKVVY
ncbi:MAG TPA: family 16 glycoside hydrolase [Chryseosolibacter sp.]